MIYIPLQIQNSPVSAPPPGEAAKPKIALIIKKAAAEQKIAVVIQKIMAALSERPLSRMPLTFHVSPGESGVFVARQAFDIANAGKCSLDWDAPLNGGILAYEHFLLTTTRTVDSLIKMFPGRPAISDIHRVIRAQWNWVEELKRAEWERQSVLWAAVFRADYGGDSPDFEESNAFVRNGARGCWCRACLEAASSDSKSDSM
ncbi:hypothetical protein SISSUDRAFT_1066841 [Sistotremastrum suecicum HHB10207 ss-3]|uniref:Uncharacterized protein n=1 Tax=Sistotremastrum suecicum HHB10207 ss-3 TaxID=1314776 RepID=A0A165XU81_9AGAM|nr:hypothetical protein SISSUDRAFT_1066841 [Sistotremastrum suecicum HHB10207 ss-3]